jgi:hypothetical protein
VKRNPEMFPLLLQLESEKGSRQVSDHPEELQNKLKHYFPSLSTHVHDWVRNPYSESSAQPKNLTLREEEEFCELKNDCTLKIRFTDLSLDKFRISKSILPFTGKLQ